MTSFCIFIAYINLREYFSTSKLQDEIKTEKLTSKLQDEIKTEKIELNKFHARDYK